MTSMRAVCWSKANKEARLMERKVCLVLDACNLGCVERRTPVQRLTPPHWWSGGRGRGLQRLTPRHWWSGGRGRGLHAEATQSALTVTLKLVSGLLSTILTVLGSVSLLFQGRFVPISLKPVLGTVAAYITVAIWPSTSPGGVSSIYNIAHRYGSVYYLWTLRRN